MMQFLWAALATAYVLIASLFAAMLLHNRSNRDTISKTSGEMKDAISETSNKMKDAIAETRSTIAELAMTVASNARAAEIYERTQTALLETIKSISAEHAAMYRDMQARSATLDERVTHHGNELRRLAQNAHDFRAEARTAIAKTHETLHAEVTRLADAHRDDMARIQLRRRSDQ